MANILGSEVTAHVIQMLTGVNGVNSFLAAAAAGDGKSVAMIGQAQVRAQNVAPDIADQSIAMQYPAINVYCEKIVNSLTAKFTSFSGSLQVAAEVRHSQDRVNGLQDALEACSDAVTQVLTANRGDWGDGMFYDGAYQVAFSAVKHGGKNFMQVAKITFEIGVIRT